MKNCSWNRIVSTLLIAVLVCTLGAPAFAEDEPIVSRTAFSISGYVVAGESVSLIAPYGGRLLDFTVRTGDVLQPRQTVFSIETQKVYAPCDGTIGGVRAQPGDETAFIQEQYGALMYLEPANRLQIDTTTSAANNDNKWIRVGETVYLRSDDSNNRIGVGYVTQVEGKRFSVEITEGTLRMDDRTTIYRTDSYVYESRIGTGKTARLNPVAITGEGSVLKVLVTEGQQVKRGEALVELVEGVLPGYTASVREGKVDSMSILSQVAVEPGQQVSRGQVLATIHPVAHLEVEADIQELDLKRIRTGDAVDIEIAALGADQLLEGTVTTISSLSHTQNGDAEYKVYVSISTNDAIREGMSATVYLNN